VSRPLSRVFHPVTRCCHSLGFIFSSDPWAPVAFFPAVDITDPRRLIFDSFFQLFFWPVLVLPLFRLSPPFAFDFPAYRLVLLEMQPFFHVFYSLFRSLLVFTIFWSMLVLALRPWLAFFFMVPPICCILPPFRRPFPSGSLLFIAPYFLITLTPAP